MSQRAESLQDVRLSPSSSLVPDNAEGLDSDSYTAQRLEHATPSHLYFTSRRCFIGPIPEGWLSKHRKSWYKHKPHFSTYSSKAATFDAAANVATRSKNLSGLDGPEGASEQPSYQGASFPQPQDLSEDEREGQRANEPVVAHNSQDYRRPDSSVQLPRVEDQGSKTTENGAAAAHDLQDAASSKLTLLIPGAAHYKKVSFRQSSGGDGSDQERFKENETSSIIARDKSGVSARSVQGGPFITAQENIVTSKSAESSTKRSKTAIDNTTPASPRDESRHMRYSVPGSLEPITPNLDLGRPSANSSLSLLRHETLEYQNNNDLQRLDSMTQQRKDAQVAQESLNFRDPVSEDVEETTIPAGTDTDAICKPTETVRLEPPDRNVAENSRKHESFATWVPQGFRGDKRKTGQLVKAERMLVRVDWTMQNLPSGYTENDSLKTQSRAVDKWREYMVVCRENDATSGEHNFVLQLNKSRVIPMKDENRTSKKVAHEICLDRHSTSINLYSSLDKSIVLWAPWKKGTRIYILKSRSSANAVEWYTFLNSILGWKRTSSLRIHVPDLNVTLELENPFRALRLATKTILADEAQEFSRAVGAPAEETVAKEIIGRCTDILARSSASIGADAWFEQGKKIGLAWKRYDRLEWVHGANEKRMYGSMAMQSTHDLELRPKQHYPTNITLNNKHGHAIEEPAALEGFLVRLTSQKGRHSRLGKAFFKRLYFSTHNQFLCFCIPGKAMPPKPPVFPRMHGKEPPKASELVGKIPIVYAVNPYPVESDKISWLGGGTTSSKKDRDRFAYEEAERRTENLLTTQGYINLCHVEKVCKLRRRSEPSQDQGAQGAVDDSDESEAESRESSQNAGDARTFEILLSNGLFIRLQAFDRTTRKEWVIRLRKLIKYWKSRSTEDMDVYKTVRQTNLEKLEIDEEMESILGQFADKWEVSRAVASPELFNMCGISGCRAITMAGMLYRKPRLHSKFRRNTVILCHGKLLIFQSTLRHATGKEIPHIYHERQDVIDLKDTYVYSGLITEGDLLYQNQTFDSNHPGHHALPRIYLEDGWTSCDEDTMTCFVIWHGKSKSFFKARAQQEDGKAKQRLRYVSSLGTPGRSMVFKTRSRAERDHWVMSINGEIERLQQAEDIRVVSQN